MRRLALATLGLLLASSAGVAAPTTPVTRERLEAAARKGDPDFPDGTKVKLTHFSEVCRLATKDGAIYVTNRRAVLTGMLAPRGQNFITFFDEKLGYLGKLRYLASLPLWCEGSKLYLFGAWDASDPGFNPCHDRLGCNVIDWVGGYHVAPKLVHEKAYGSSGGVEDP